MSEGPTAIERYRQLREQISSGKVRSLEQMHCTHLTCRPGCHECCVNLTVFPVEFYAILDDLRLAGVTKLDFDREASCGYLKDGLCTIYQVRPMICRTHGLPIAFLNMDADEPEMSVSFCPKNFIDADESIFSEETTLNIDELNYQLYEANLRFIEENPQLQLAPDSRICLSDLPLYLDQQVAKKR